MTHTKDSQDVIRDSERYTLREAAIKFADSTYSRKRTSAEGILSKAFDTGKLKPSFPAYLPNAYIVSFGTAVLTAYSIPHNFNHIELQHNEKIWIIERLAKEGLPFNEANRLNAYHALQDCEDARIETLMSRFNKLNFEALTIEWLEYRGEYNKKLFNNASGIIDLNKPIFSYVDIHEYCEKEGIHHEYFNPVNPAPEPGKTKDECWDILNPDGDYFPVELAALIRAWREVTAPGNKYIEQNMTPKQSIAACLRDNAEIWQLVDEGEILPTRKSEDLAAVASWSDKPGRPKVN